MTPAATSQGSPRVVLVLQVQRLAALWEVQETCRRAREYFGDCRVIVLADAAASPFVERLGCADEVVCMSRWNRRRMHALVRRLRRRGVTDTCITYDSAAQPGPARLEWLALAMRKPVCYREVGGAIAPISRARLVARLAAEATLAALAAIAGAAAAMMMTGALLLSALALASPRRRETRRRRRIAAWNREWLRRL